MSGVVTAAVVGVSMYSTYESNKRQDRIAKDQNRNNRIAHDMSVSNAEEYGRQRRDELLRRFNISSSKLKDTSQDVMQGSEIKLTALDMAFAKAASATDNAIASKHITGRLADRMRSVMSIGNSMEKGNIVQDTEAQLTAIGNKLETLEMNRETQAMDVDIDVTNSINTANNSLVTNHAYSQSTGLAGTLATGLSSGVMAYGAMK